MASEGRQSLTRPKVSSPINPLQLCVSLLHVTQVSDILLMAGLLLGLQPPLTSLSQCSAMPAAQDTEHHHDTP